MPQTLHIRLLGTFALVYGDEPVAGIHAARLQSLLAYLVLHRDAPPPRQRVAFQFWPDSPEAQARNNLRQALHALRLALPDADAFLSADANTLRWRPDAPIALDVAEFEDALRRAEAAERRSERDAQRAALERAAELYRADLLPGCYDDWIAPERERLRQRHLEALDRLIALLEARHDLAAAIGYARRLLLVDALNEGAYRRLMRLLALHGDRAGALSVYHSCVTTLRSELGVEPGAEMQASYQRLLRADAGSAPSRPAPGRQEAARTLVGRRREWQQLREAWAGARAGRPGFALVSGEAGIGKSRLAEEFLRWSGQHGATVAKARCYAAEGRLSLAPVTEWLRGEGVRPFLGQVDRVWLTEVARVLPEVLAEHPDLPRYEPIGESGQRQRFFEALARAVLAAPPPLVLLIDDLHWCDQETLEWLHFLLRFDATARMLVVGTERVEEVAPGGPLRALTLELRNSIDVTQVALPPLDAAETARLAATVGGRELDVAAALRVYRETEGNPLFVVEAVQAGLDELVAGGESADEPSGRPAASHAVELPPRVRALFAARLARLSAPARDLAALAATIGREFRFDVLALAGGGDEDGAVRALDELWQRRIVREQGANTYDFTHDKLREVAYAEIGAPQRRLLHRRIAQALETIDADDLDAASGEVATHYEHAGLGERAIPYYRRAAAVARRVYAHEDAINLLLRALALLERLPAGARRDAQELDLQLALAPIYRTTRGWTAPELERVVERAIELCDRVGSDEQRAEVLYGWESLLTVQAKLEKVLAVDEEVRTLHRRLGRPDTTFSGMMVAGARLHLGHFVVASEGFDRMIAAYDPAQVLALQDSQGWNNAVHSRAWQSHALWCLGWPERAVALGLDAVRLAETFELPFNQAVAATYLALLQQLCADEATARAHAEAALALAARCKAPYYRAWSAILVRHAEASERPDAPHLAALREAIADFMASGARLRLPYYLGLVADVCGRAGRTEKGLAAVEEGLGAARANNERWWDAELHRLRGELLAARGADEHDVEAALSRAAEIARTQAARSLELRATLSLAQWWCARDRGDEARRLLRDVYAGFSEGLDTPDLRAARSLLDAPA